jgi:RcsF protein
MTYRVKKMNKNLILVIPFIVLLIGGCAKQYQFSSNLDPQKFNDYFAPQKVKMFKKIQDLPKQHELVAIVEGTDCQIKAHHAIPSEVNARTMARLKARKLDANAIIFSQCITIEDMHCHDKIICHGQAYKVIADNG